MVYHPSLVQFEHASSVVVHPTHDNMCALLQNLVWQFIRTGGFQGCVGNSSSSG